LERKKLSAQALYENCLLAAAEHALYVLKHPFFAYEQSWDGNNYSFAIGTVRGTISFDLENDIFAGAVRQDDSARCKLYPDHDTMTYFEQAPDNVKALAEQETIQYLFDEVDGVEKSMITAAFWGVDGELFIPDAPDDFCTHGGEYPTLLCGEAEAVWQYWLEQYELRQEEQRLADYIFQHCRVGNKLLNQKEMKKICKIKGKEPGYNAYLESLAEMGLSW